MRLYVALKHKKLNHSVEVESIWHFTPHNSGLLIQGFSGVFQDGKDQAWVCCDS